MSHYYAEKMFNPVLVSPAFKTNKVTKALTDEVDVFIVSEILEEMNNLLLEISVHRFDTIAGFWSTAKRIGKISGRGCNNRLCCERILCLDS